ncbi:STAS domain-containing protein [Streptomyces sp. NBC_00347]|uniref:STAS domain-containing protein n=1 Tax=Streptomyces sp. NBC_00347 TaxID=2975721 RepID=UPI00224D9667|nr:STAS domain-containing protein [Streptomyces sp. NBC_00347]MCX5126985.1 STAS domain-containing protein [Streptomyces sp. NBC_00347]
MTTALIDLKTTARNAGGLRIALAGELDFHTAALVEPGLADLVGSGHRSLDLDLSGLTFCDSGGIDLLLRVDHSCRALGTRLHLRDVPPLVAKSMRILGVDRVLRLVAT